MKKFIQIIYFTLAALISVSFVIYAFIKAKDAESAKKKAECLQTEVIELRSQAEELKEAAMMAAAQARQAEADALRAVVECEAKMNR